MEVNHIILKPLGYSNNYDNFHLLHKHCHIQKSCFGSISMEKSRQTLMNGSLKTKSR